MSDFNRGLEQGIALGKMKERERIIKLLEDEMFSDDDTAWQTRDWAQVERQQDLDEIVKEAIALIKGENK